MEISRGAARTLWVPRCELGQGVQTPAPPPAAAAPAPERPPVSQPLVARQAGVWPRPDVSLAVSEERTPGDAS